MHNNNIGQVDTDAKHMAQAVGLRYVNDTMPGITRVKKGKGWRYINHDGTLCTDVQTLKRLKNLVLPPAWTDVWICTHENGHLQATGLDALRRKQYRYHANWNAVRNETKFYRLYEFGNSLHTIRQNIEHDLALSGLPMRKVLAIIIHLMERTSIRIGNNEYRKLYGSYGLTTLRDKHVLINGSKLKLEFTGKKGIKHVIECKSSRLARLVKKCRDIPGQELFQYFDEEGNRKPVDSGMVNNYIREISGNNFTAKDFRTWKGSVLALQNFLHIGLAQNLSDTKKNIIKAIDEVSHQLGNTRTVCKKYYIHPVVLEYYENGKLAEYIRIPLNEKQGEKDSLLPEEILLLKILKTQVQNNPADARYSIKKEITFSLST